MALKVFISFKTEDEPLAEALYLGLTKGGALVYQFRKTAKPGTSAWGVICNSISDSDVFVVFISRRSLKSRPVAAEIDHAHYEFVNASRPARLIPVLVELGLEPPAVLKRFSTYALDDPTTGIQALVAEVLRTERDGMSPTGVIPTELSMANPAETSRFATPVATPIPAEPSAAGDTVRSWEKQAGAGEDGAAVTALKPGAPGATSSPRRKREGSSTRPPKGTLDRPKPKGAAGESSLPGRISPSKPIGAATRDRRADPARVRVASAPAIARPQGQQHSSATPLPGLSVVKNEPNSVPSLVSYLLAVAAVTFAGAILAGLVADLAGLVADRITAVKGWEAVVVEPVLSTVGRWAEASPWWGRVTLLVAYFFSFFGSLGLAEEELPIDTWDYVKVSGKSVMTACVCALIWLTLFSRTDVDLLDFAVSWIGWLPTPWASGSVWSRVTAGAVYLSGLALAGYAVSRPNPAHHKPLLPFIGSG